MNIYKKLYNVQQSLKAPKDLHNSFANYNYRTTEAILEAAKPLLKENNLIILLDDEVETKGEYNYIRATAKIVDIETGEHIETSALAREDRDRKKFDAPQISGSCSSYARKYALSGLLAIDNTSDSDVTNTQQDEEEHKAAKEDKPTFAGPASEKVNVKNIWTKGTTNQEEDKVISFNQSSQDLITKSEMMFIYSRGFQAGYSQDQVKNHIIKKFNKTIDQLTKVEATKIVEGYQSKILKKMEG
ncbi:ERF family protein [Intestinibacter bartlettii]|uniref:ERF family protein n=1 Tax=Intestinibacter bartlettii TaxID=261299 RepID=UPI0032199978